MLKRFIPFWSIPILLIFSVGTVWLRLAIVRTTYEINEATRGIEQLRQEKEKLELKIAELRSPRRLEMLARTQFGLSQPKMEQVVRLKLEARPLHVD